MPQQLHYELLVQAPLLLTNLREAQHCLCSPAQPRGLHHWFSRTGPPFASVPGAASFAWAHVCLVEPELLLSTRSAVQGTTVAVLVAPAPPRSPLGLIRRLLAERKGDLVEVRGLLGMPVPVFRLDSCVWRAYVPVTPLQDPGQYNVQVRVRDGLHKAVDVPVEVVAGDFPVEQLWFRRSKAALVPSERETAQVLQACRSCSPAQLWRGAFMAPCPGRVTTPYGVRRFYNGVWRPDYFHRGLDYAGDAGQAVQAPAAGRVVLVGREQDGFAVHGNCLGLDHGAGLTSLFLHLQDLAVREGDVVKQGEDIGTIGVTGMATGPHLHWGMFASGEAVDPSAWLDTPDSRAKAAIWKF
ncbi:hypothetical protein WJX72_003816 [[Myrmecia] bisecta]|uniref:M23ase beta-sheet core domain-containing protein n=1 Tax=[Myrmecia] bisecta TaxID=41462 RepID=A0AAW1QQ40_9CHLO